jgi:hypothetical protein
MVLAFWDIHVRENELEARTRMEDRGIPIAELERLAQQYGLVAEIQDVAFEALRDVLTEGRLPIAYIDRAVFDLNPAQRRHHSIRNAIIHNVIPVKITDASVTLHDPRFPLVTRRSTRLFRQAYACLGGRCVVCSRPAEA